MNETKLKMTVDEALELSDEWTKGATFHADSQGWRVVCAVLAEEVRKLRYEKAFYFLNPREHRAMKNALNRSVTFIDEKMESKKSEVDEANARMSFTQAWLARAKNDAGK